MKIYLVIFFTIFLDKIAFAQCNNDTLTIGQDTTLCTGQSITLHADQAYISYLWNNGTTASSIQVTTPGIYYCRAKIVDSSNLVVNGDFYFGSMFFTSNYIYGTGGSYGLLSNEGQFAISTNASYTHINFSACTDHTSGTGNFMIVNGSATANQNVWCQTLSVYPSTDYIFSAWFTSVHPTNPAILNFSINGISIGANVFVSSTTCLWQNFFHTWTSGISQTTANICITNQNINPSGNDFAIDDIYFARVCEFHDTVVVDYDTYPNINLGNDTLICTGDTLHLDATADTNSTYLWKYGSTNPIFDAIISDTLWVDVANGYCASSDTIIVNTSSYPTVNLGHDTTICNGDSLLIDAGNSGANYLWQDNSTNSQYLISNSGIYWVNVYNNIHCINTDTISVSIGNNPIPFLNPNLAFCQGDSVKLDPGNFANYLWTNGNQQSYIWVKPLISTNYGVIVWDSLGCFDSTSANVIPIEIPKVDIISNEDTICLGNTLILEASGGQNYIWNNGISSGNIWQFTPAKSDVYTVTVSNSFNNVECKSDTSIFIYTRDCNTLFIPNAFSPNGDGLNDDFGPVGEFNLQSYEFYIYNRWGKLMFSTKDINKHWDGKDDNGEYMPNGVYAYLLRIKEPLIDSYMLSGTVHLLR